MTPNAIAPRFVCALSAAILLLASMAGAQPAASETDSPTLPWSPAWELEIHGGRSLVTGAMQGSGTIPTTGAIDQGRLTASTLYFGTAASLFNANQTALGSNALITALDATLQNAAVRRAPDAVGGLRLQRRLTPRFAVEVSGDYAFAPLAFQASALAGLEAARSSYQLALKNVLARSTLPSTVTSVSTVNDTPSAAQVSVTGAAVVHLRTHGRVRPYLTGGAGILFNQGTLPSATLAGSVLFGDQSQLLATDTVTLRFTQPSHSVLYVGGGGFTLDATRHLGLRADARVQAFRNALTTSIGATPSRQLRSGGGTFPSLTAGSVQFSPIAPLSGAALADSTVFTGSGLEFHTVLSVGLFLRF